VNGIASLARMGKAMPQTFILNVTTNSGKVLKKFEQPKGKQVVKPDSAYIVNNMASDPNASYLGGSCTATDCKGMKFHRYKGWTNAIKTGTTNFAFDGLMMTWNPKYTAGIWIGNHTRTEALRTSPENITDPIMKSFMQGAIDNLGPTAKAQQFVQPNGIKTAPAFVYTNRYGGQTVPSPSTDIYPSWYVGTAKSSTATIDKVSNKLATSCTPTLARQNSSNGNAASWNVDVFMGGNASSTATTSNESQGSDDVHSCSDSVPTVTITAVNGTSTGGNSTPNCPTNGCTIMVHVEQGTHELNDSSRADYPGTLNLVVNGQTVQTQQISNTGDYQLTYTPGSGTNGSVQLEAQITDSVLYQGTDTKTINIGGSHSSFVPSTSGGRGRRGRQQSTDLT
jgi:membrane peptidoglycan carboxypeptidase